MASTVGGDTDSTAAVWQAGGLPVALDWQPLLERLDEHGVARTPPMLSPQQCEALIALYAEDERFRSHIVMQRHGFGQGEYRYLRYPLPALVQSLREQVYARLQPLANAWYQRMHGDTPYPATHAEFLALCHARGQTRPTPLLLRYRRDDYNRLHQDLYGELHFPLQMAILLSRPGTDFEGGELVLTEQKPRAQSRARVVHLERGEAAIFACAARPVRGQRGDYRCVMRHGVSDLTRGNRYVLGIIFHDAS